MTDHTLIVGQSGCGKSSVVRRIVEEVIIQTNFKIIILDLNADFVRIKQVKNKDDTGFRRVWDKKMNSELSLFSPSFSDRNNLNISWDDIDKEELRELLSLTPAEEPEATYLVDFIKEEGKEWTFGEWKEVASSIVKWARQYFQGCPSKLETLARFISVTTSIRTAQRVATALKDVFDLGIWDEQASCYGLSSLFPSERQYKGDLRQKLLPQVTCVDLATLGEDLSRLFISRYLLKRLWSTVRHDYSYTIKKKQPDERVPIFVIVDEAHRLASDRPQGPLEASLLGWFRRIAAEGRKHKLFLMLATQRPLKLHGDVLSECQNLCVMRLVTETDRTLLSKSLGFIKKNTLARAKKFRNGQCMFAGSWTNYEIREVKKALPYRTEPSIVK